uniref:Uncharacterized protein n=1 Tax=Zea mays TaxID=4577 RepID=C4J8R1_MAIZE|nr:unknown [Zea mays]
MTAVVSVVEAKRKESMETIQLYKTCISWM